MCWYQRMSYNRWTHGMAVCKGQEVIMRVNERVSQLDNV